MKGNFTNRQGRKVVPWPGIPESFEDWEPQKNIKGLDLIGCQIMYSGEP